MGVKQYKIAHILPWPSIGGTEYATLRIAQAMESATFRSMAFCPGAQTPVGEMFANAGFEIAAYQAVEPSYRHPKNFLRASFNLASDLRRHKISVVHCSDLLAAHYAGIAGRLSMLPVICHIRCCYENISRRDRSFLQPINKFVFVSYDTWKQFGYYVSKRRGAVVYDGLEPASNSAESESRESVRAEFGIPEHAKIVGMVARVAPAKDFPTLARAAARIVAAMPGVRFLIIGDCSRGEYGEHYRRVKEVIEASGVESYFIFTGFRTDVERMLRAMDIFVLSTHTEGLPLVIMEALAYGKPVVATAVGGIPEIILDGQTGLLHRHGDDEQLAEKLLSVLKNDALAANLGQAGRLFVERNFNRRQLAINMRAVYDQVLGRGGYRSSGSNGISRESFSDGI